jgi:hypothetical protein
MTPLLLRIAIAAFLSLASLVVVLFRVSPLAAPTIAIPFFILTIFLTVASFGTLAFYFLWKSLSVEGMDAGRRMSVALREGLFLGAATVLLFLFLILGILTWWIGLLIYTVFVLVEMALHS